MATETIAVTVYIPGDLAELLDLACAGFLKNTKETITRETAVQIIAIHAIRGYLKGIKQDAKT